MLRLVWVALLLCVGFVFSCVLRVCLGVLLVFVGIVCIVCGFWLLLWVLVLALLLCGMIGWLVFACVVELIA